MMVSSQFWQILSVGSAIMSARSSVRCCSLNVPASVGRRATSTAHANMSLPNAWYRADRPAMSTGRAKEHSSHRIDPHMRQWYLRRKKPNDLAHPGHSDTSLSSTHGTMPCSYSADQNKFHHCMHRITAPRRLWRPALPSVPCSSGPVYRIFRMSRLCRDD